MVVYFKQTHPYNKCQFFHVMQFGMKMFTAFINYNKIDRTIIIKNESDNSEHSHGLHSKNIKHIASSILLINQNYEKSHQ